jgi:ribosomal protein L12E/L44/L45/RPP1/RPP2
VNQNAVLLAVPAAGQAAEEEGMKYNKEDSDKGKKTEETNIKEENDIKTK